MIKLLQQQAQCYFHNRTHLLQSYHQLTQNSQKIHFFLMLIHSHIPLEQLVTLISEIATPQPNNIAPLLTALWSSSLHLESTSEPAKKLNNLLSQLHARNLIDKSQLMSQLPEWMVQGAGIVDLAGFERRTARVYTKINYEQAKHSLIRQNNQGYSKLTLLLVGLKDSHDGQAVWRKIVSLIGNFDLDPDRVLDLVVECRLQNNQSKRFMQILSHFRKESVVQTIGNLMILQKTKPNDLPMAEKTIYCGPPDAFDGSDPQELFNQIPLLPNPRLFELTAKSIKDGLFTYADILPYLEPTDSVLKRISGKRSQLTLAKINKSFVLSMVELDTNQIAQQFNQQNYQFQGQLLYSTKLSLLTHMVKCNNWSDFVVSWAPFKSRFDLILYQPLLHQLLDLLQWAIQPLFEPISFRRYFSIERKGQYFEEQGNIKQFTRINQLDQNSIQKLNQLMIYIGKKIAFRPKLYIKLCRILKFYTKELQNNTVIQLKIKQITKQYLVPSNIYAEVNGPMSIQLYSLLQCFEYQFRYQCYLLVYRESMTGCPFSARIFQSVKRRQNIIVNNLSKQNKKTFVRKISKITHNQALPVLYWIARRIVMEDYEAVVPEIVAVLCNSTPLTLDMTIFVMLYTLNENKQSPVNIKTHQFQPWFKNVITFISTFFRKYLEADIQPVFDYILLKTALPFSVLQETDQLPGALLKLLHEILNKMHGSVMIQEVNKTKLDAIAAGPKLQAEILQFSSQIRAAKKSKIMLQKFFWEQNRDHHKGRSLAFNLLVLLCQKRGQVFTKAFIDDLRIVADIYDQYTLLIVQIVRVLLYQAQDYSHYALLLPQKPLATILSQYKIPFEFACEIVRPGIKHISTMNTQQWNKLVLEITQAFSQSLQDPKYLLSRPNEKVKAYLQLYKARVLELLPPSFFTAFWFLTIDSVYFPAKSYSEKLEDIKKKLQQSTSRRNQKDTQKLKTLLQKLTKEQEQQRRKFTDTLSQASLSKLQVEILKGGDKQKDKKQNTLLQFAQMFVQICLLPRMMLDRAQALFCVKFTTQMIKANKMPATKSIRLVTYIIEFVMNYLPYTTHREASNCLSVFLAEILAIFQNWSDSAKLKQDMKRILGVQQTAGKDNYVKLRDYLIKLFERVGNIVKSIKEQPYIIKNCLYLLQKVESIPGYKQQADELMQHMNQLKELYTAVDMRTILDRQIAMLTVKKTELPDKPQEKKLDDKKPPGKPQIEDNQPPLKQPIQQNKSPIRTNNNNSKSPIRNNNNNNNNSHSRPNDLPLKTVQHIVSSTPPQQTFNKPYPPNPGPPKRTGPSQDRNKMNEMNRPLEKVQEDRLKFKPESRFSDRPPEKKTQFREQSKNYRVRQQPKKDQNRQSNAMIAELPKQTIINETPKDLKPIIPEQKQTKSIVTQPKPFSQPIRQVSFSTGFTNEPKITQTSKQIKNINQNKQIKSVPDTHKQIKNFTDPKTDNKSELSNVSIPPPKRVSDVRREQELKQQNFSTHQGFTSQPSLPNQQAPAIQISQSGSSQIGASQQRDSSTKPRQQLLKKETIDNNSKNQKPTSSVYADRSPKEARQTENQPKHQIPNFSQERRSIPRQNLSSIPRQIQQDFPREERDNSRIRDLSKERFTDKIQLKGQKTDRRKEQNIDSKKDIRWKDEGKKWQGKPKQNYFSKERKSEERQGKQMKKDEKRDKQREKDKDRQRRHEKYRSRSREKYGRR